MLVSPISPVRRPTCGRPAVVMAIMGCFMLPSAGAGQDVVDLAGQCATNSIELVPWCQELSLAALGVQRGIGLASSFGSDIPGSPSTMGRRLGSTPRIGLSISGVGLRVGMPEVVRGSSSGTNGQETFSLLGFRLGAAVGALEGLQLAPTVGGVFSVDVLGSYSYLRLPGGAGFDGSSSGVGLGARVGLLRESFTLPGISVSAMRRWHGDVQIGSLTDGDPGEVETDVTVSSLRATVGKNFFALGLMAGVGWDRYDGDTRLLASGTGVPPVLASASGDVQTDRTLYFVSGWFNFLVYQVSAEIGRGNGQPDPFPARAGAFDPGDPTWFATVALRITL